MNVSRIRGTDLWIAECPDCLWVSDYACSDKEECEREARFHRCEVQIYTCQRCGAYWGPEHRKCPSCGGTLA